MGAARRTTRATDRWSATLDRLDTSSRDDLDGSDLDLLADALFWLDRVDESIDARRSAYRRHEATGDRDAAARAAWRLFYDHFLVGETAIAAGWIERCRTYVEGDDANAGWLAIADADLSATAGDDDGALTAASRAVKIARARTDRDLLAMALQAAGRARIRAGDRAAGMRLLDEAMVAVTAGELDELYTGWVYCNVVSTCYELADLDRAAQWSDAAMRWCATLAEGRMYPGLCRVYSVELAALRGDWDRAAVEAARACGELTAFDPRYAGEAFYQLGEMRRRRGDASEAEEAFVRANELGRTPQPGLALLAHQRGATAEAVAMLRACTGDAGDSPLPHSLLLAELCALEAAAGNARGADAAADVLTRLASAQPSEVIQAIAAGAAGRARLAGGDAPGSLELLRDAADRLAELRIPYESARLRLAASHAAAEAGRHESALAEARTATRTFERLDAFDREEAENWTATLAHRSDPSPSVEPVGSLTERESEVLQLVAAGLTNRQIATDLSLSPHTVNRHLTNIFTKIDVSSRAAATAFAYERGIVDRSRQEEHR